MTNHLETVKEHILEIWKEVGKTLWIENPKATLSSLKKVNELALKFCKPEKIKIGHIVAFQKGKETEIYRILGFWNKGSHLFFFTQQENSFKMCLTEQENLLGRIVEAKRKGKTVSLRNFGHRVLDLFDVMMRWILGLFAIFNK